MARIADCYDNATSEYQPSPGAGPRTRDVNIALRIGHKLVWHDWLASSLEAQQADLILYLRSLPESMELLLTVWRDTRPFLVFIPPSALPEERAVFTSNLTVMVLLLCNEYAPQLRSVPKVFPQKQVQLLNLP